MEDASPKYPTAIDSSLDDIIKSNRGSRSRRQPSRGRSPPRSSSSSRNRRFARPSSVSSAAIRKPYADDRRSQSRNSPFSGRSTRGGSITIVNDKKGMVGGRLSISNLHHNVLRSDLEELFRDEGEVKDIKLKYDRSGRSTGVAEVYFVNRNDAMAAAEKFHNVPLDGFPMSVSFDYDFKRPSSGRRDHNKASRSNAMDGDWNQGKVMQVDKGSLDADLDSYMMNQS